MRKNTVSGKPLRWSLGLGLIVLLSGCNARVSTANHAMPAPLPAAKPVVVEAQPQWFSCKQDSDCVVERGLCSSQQAVNQAFLEPFRNYRDRMDSKIECSTKPSLEPAATAQCLKQRCAIKPAVPGADKTNSHGG